MVAVPETPASASGEVIVTDGGWSTKLSTVTDTGADSVDWSPVSVAVAVIVCGPLPTSVVSQLTDQPFAPFVSVPTTLPSTSKTTRVTPSSSEAVAVMFTEPETTAPFEGEVICTDGGWSVGCSDSTKKSSPAQDCPSMFGPLSTWTVPGTGTPFSMRIRRRIPSVRV